MFESKRVARGAAWLDTVAPGWESKVDVTKLDMRYGQSCVCGQVFGNWEDSPKVKEWTHVIENAGLPRALLAAIRAMVWSVRRGFGTKNTSLRLVWADLIVARRTERVVLVDAEGVEPAVLV